MHEPTRKHSIIRFTADKRLLNDRQVMLHALLISCKQGGATVLGELTHSFDPEGVSVVLLLAESHASIHTWPEHGVAELDVYTCGDIDPDAIADIFLRRIGGAVVARQRLNL